MRLQQESRAITGTRGRTEEKCGLVRNQFAGEQRPILTNLLVGLLGG